jgi:hypothetical protein
MKTYRALISQAADQAPTASIISNGLGYDISFERTEAGVYQIIGNFPEGRTYYAITNNLPQPGMLTISKESNDRLQIVCSLGDNQMNYVPVEIIIYADTVDD